ncbi:MAG: PAS domain S-box protein [Bacteroidales bacterium]|nr:PAS domain S-box protein [Bacteroidales bacterium]
MDKKITDNTKRGIGQNKLRNAHGDLLAEIARLNARIRKLESENQKLRNGHNKIHDIEKALSESEERYNTLLKSSKNIIMMIHKDVILYSNLSGLRVLGYSSINELKGKNFFDILDPLYFGCFRKVFQRMEQVKSSEAVQLKLIRKDGSRVLIEFTALPMEYENRKAILAIGQNITPWKETELALRESEQKLKALFDCSPDYYFITDPDYKIRFFNKPLPCFTIHDLLDKRIIGLFSDDYKDIFRKSLDQVKKTSRTTGFEISLSKGVVTNWYNCRIAELTYVNKPEGFIVVLTDITQQKDAEIKLTESEQRYISLFDNINSGVIILQPDKTTAEFTIRDINKAALKIFRINKNELKGRLISELIQSHKDAKITEKIKTVCQNRQPLFIPAQYYQTGQFDGWLEHYIYQLPQGEIIVVIEDVTEKYLAANELNKARHEWQGIFEAIGQPTIIIDKECNILAANKSVVEFTGKSHEELKNSKCYDIFHSTKGQMAEGCPMKELLRSKKFQTREMEVETLSGTYMVSCTPVLDSDGEVIKVIHVATDITEIKKAKENLAASLKRYQKLMDTIPYGVDEINTEGTILLTNTAHAKMLGCKAEDLIGKTILDLQTTAEARDHAKNSFKKILSEHPEPVPFFVKNKTCNGKVIDVQIDWNYLEESDGQLSGFITVISDITERVKYEKALDNARLKAEESDRLKSAFLTNMSHEIRTPLNAIIGFTTMLNEENLDPEKRKNYRKYIHEGASQLLAIINNIIDISKLEAGQLPVLMKKIDLNQIMMELKDYFENEVKKMNKHELRMQVNIPGQHEKFYVVTDEIKLRQVLINLLSNAVKFTEKGIVEFGYKKTGKMMLQFFVKDSGIGIAKKNQAAIFERFRQEDETITREYGGAGLGLAITKGILDMLGGTIQLKSEKNKGSEFIFTLPYQSSKTRTIKEAGKKASVKLEGRKILAVEDDPLNIAFTEATLKLTGATLILAKDGKEAIDSFRKNMDIDLVLLDIRLPYFDGYSVAKKMKKLRPGIPILAYTANAMDKDKIKAREAGIDRYLTKPSGSEEILQAIGELIGIPD